MLLQFMTALQLKSHSNSYSTYLNFCWPLLDIIQQFLYWQFIALTVYVVMINHQLSFANTQCLMYLYHYPDIWYDYAMWYASIGSVDSAIKIFQRALKALPGIVIFSSLHSGKPYPITFFCHCPKYGYILFAALSIQLLNIQFHSLGFCFPLLLLMHYTNASNIFCRNLLL